MNTHRSATYFLAGWLLASALFQAPKTTVLPSRMAPPVPPGELLKRGTVRELRALEGLGPKRAQALVNARSTKGELPPLEEIPGIGTWTAARLQGYVR